MSRLLAPRQSPASEPAAAPVTTAAAAAASTAATSRRALFAAASGRDILASHARLIGDLVARRHRVVCLAPLMTAGDAAAIAALGAETRSWPAAASFLKLLADRHEASGLKALIADWQPHVALVDACETTLPVLAACHAARVPRVLARVDGLAGFEDGSGAAPANVRGWRRAFERIDGAVFSNADDARALASADVLGDRLATAVAAPGVDLAAHPLQPLPGLGDGLVFAMVAPLDRRHGVGEFLEAAALVAAQSPTARFLLAGPLPADGGIAAERITASAGTVDYLGAAVDLAAVLARAHVFVYPARGGVGVPTEVLAALAAGRPVVTTATAGCRDTVDERVNGCLVPPGDAAALAEAMVSFLRRPDLIPSMARAARLKAERGFDAQAATTRLDALLGLG